MAPASPFQPVGIITTDDRRRIPLHKAGACPHQQYAVARHDDGRILLIPMVTIPEREYVTWQNPDTLDQLHQGLTESGRGDLYDLGDFTGDLPTTDDGAA